MSFPAFEHICKCCSRKSKPMAAGLFKRARISPGSTPVFVLRSGTTPTIASIRTPAFKSAITTLRWESMALSYPFSLGSPAHLMLHDELFLGDDASWRASPQVQRPVLRWGLLAM